MKGRGVAALLALSVGATTAAAGCRAHDSWPSSTGGRLRVVAAFYPLAELARRVGGADVSVLDLTPAGAEPHDVEIRSPQVDRIEDADLALVVGGGFQPAVEAATRRAGIRRVDLLDALGPAGARHGTGNDPATDPHFWLDPSLFGAAAAHVASAMAALRPAAAARFAARSGAYRATLEALDARYSAGLAGCARRVVVTTHAAFAYLTARYGLRQEAVTGLSPEAEPDPARLGELSRLVDREGVTTVFTEPGTSTRVARTLARETGARVRTLSPLETLTPAERRSGDDYVAVMGANLDELVAALDCGRA